MEEKRRYTIPTVKCGEPFGRKIGFCFLHKAYKQEWGLNNCVLNCYHWLSLFFITDIVVVSLDLIRVEDRVGEIMCVVKEGEKSLLCKLYLTSSVICRAMQAVR